MVRHVPKASIPRVAAFVVAAIVAFGGLLQSPRRRSGCGASPGPRPGAHRRCAPRSCAGARRAHAPAAVAATLCAWFQVVDLDRRPAPGDRLRLLFALKRDVRRSGPALARRGIRRRLVAAKFFYYRGPITMSVAEGRSGAAPQTDCWRRSAKLLRLDPASDPWPSGAARRNILGGRQRERRSGLRLEARSNPRRRRRSRPVCSRQA